MKIAISANSPHPDARFESRFGRCPYFIFLDTATQDRHAEPNPAAQDRGGAGTRAAQFLSNQGVEAVISGRFGPNAYTALEAANIKMYQTQGGSMESIMEDFQAEELDQVTSSSGTGRGRGRGRRRR